MSIADPTLLKNNSICIFGKYVWRIIRCGKTCQHKVQQGYGDSGISGTLENVSYRHDDLFNLDIPKECPGVPSEILDASSMWSDKSSYDIAARKLAGMFVENFEKFSDASSETRAAGPNA